MAEEVKKAGKSSTKKAEETVEVVNDTTLSSLMEMMNQLKDQISELKQENETLKKGEKTEKIEMNSDEEIEVMSLFAGTLKLFTEGFGNGTKYEFDEGYGCVIDIPFSDLKQIVKNNTKITKDGYFYILNEDAISALRLKKAYDNLLSYEKMKDLEKATSEQVVALYNSAPNSQKELIITYFSTKKADKKPLDMSILYKLQEISGKTLLD